jgi:hypothetical protein
VLAPNGKLAMHDMVLHDQNHPQAPDAEIWPKENYLPDLDAYRENLLRVGFRHVRVEDISQFSFNSLMEYAVRKSEKDIDKKHNHQALENAMAALRGRSAWMPPSCSCCLVFAIK